MNEETKNSCVDEWVDRSNRNNKEVEEWRKNIEKDLKMNNKNKKAIKIGGTWEYGEKVYYSEEEFVLDLINKLSGFEEK